ncbi:MAG: SRPBCC family protein [Trebonia sp.]
MTSESWHISERIDRPVAEVYAYVSNPANLPRWAPGLGNSVAEADGQWFVDTPAERARLDFAPRNDFGILDHYLTFDSGEVIYVPLRVIADESGSEVVFTLRRRPGMTDDEFKADGEAVAADLARLKRVLEG